MDAWRMLYAAEGGVIIALGAGFRHIKFMVAKAAEGGVVVWLGQPVTRTLALQVADAVWLASPACRPVRVIDSTGLEVFVEVAYETANA